MAEPVRKGGFSGLLNKVSKLHNTINSRRPDDSLLNMSNVSAGKESWAQRKGSIKSTVSGRSESITVAESEIAGDEYDEEDEEEETEADTEAGASEGNPPPPSEDSISELYKYSTGTSVQAHGLTQVAGLNGKRGVVVDDDRPDNRVVVDFGPPFGRRALRIKRLMILDLEHDLNIMYIGMAKWFRCVFRVAKVSPNQRKVVGSLARRETRLWVVDLLSRHIYRPAYSQSATDAIQQITDPTTKSHQHSDLIKIQLDLLETKRLHLRCTRTGHEHDLEFLSAQERQRFYECAKGMRMDLLWCPYMCLSSRKPCTVGISGSTEVPIVHGAPGEVQRMSGETRLFVSPTPTTGSSVWVGTIDVTDSQLTVDDDTSQWLSPGSAELVVLSVVGVTYDKETKKDKDYEKYGSIITEKLKANYIPLLSTEQSSNKKSVIIMVYAKRSIVAAISNIQAWAGCHTRTFKARKLLTKSQSVITDMVTMSFSLRESPMCFVATSLKNIAEGASEESTAARNEVLRLLLEKADAGAHGDMLHRYHHVFILGGLGHGFKGATTPDQWTTLSALPRGSDRLAKEVAVGNILDGFNEGDLTLSNELQHASLEQRVMWKSLPLYDMRPTNYAAHDVAGMPATCAAFKFDTQLLFCEAFSRPCAKRAVMVDKCVVSYDIKKLSLKAHISAWAPFAEMPSARSPELRPEGAEYHGGAFAVMDPITHSAENLARQYLLLSLRDKDELIGTTRVMLSDAVANVGKPVSFTGFLGRGGIKVSGKITGTIRITEDNSPLLLYQEEMKEQFKSALAMLVKEEEMDRVQIMREEQMNAEPLVKMDEVSRVQCEARYKERILRLRAACRTTEKDEDVARKEVERLQEAARMALSSRVQEEKKHVLVLKARRDVERGETRVRMKLKDDEEAQWVALTWKQTARYQLMKEETPGRDALLKKQMEEHNVLVTAAASSKMKIRRKIEDAKSARAQERQDFAHEETADRKTIQAEEDDARYDLEILMTNELFGTRKMLSERLGSEEDCRKAIMSLEETIREKIEDDEDDKWFEMGRWLGVGLMRETNKQLNTVTSDEAYLRNETSLEEKMQWENITGEESASWRKAARDTARVPNKSLDAAILSRKTAIQSPLPRFRTVESACTQPPSECTASSCGRASPCASEAEAPRTPSPAIPLTPFVPSDDNADVLSMLRAADQALARVDAKLAEPPPRIPPSPPASPKYDMHSAQQCLSKDEASELRAEVSAHRHELAALRHTLEAGRIRRSPSPPKRGSSPLVQHDFEARVQSLERDMRLTALESRLASQASEAARWRAAVALVDEPVVHEVIGCPTCGHDAVSAVNDASALLNKNTKKQRLLTEALARVSRIKSSSRHFSSSSSPISSPQVSPPPKHTNFLKQSRHRSPSPSPQVLSPSLGLRGRCRGADRMASY